MAGGMCGGGVHGRGACVAGGMCGRGHAWQGEACMAGGVRSRGVCMAGVCVWQGGMCGRGVYVACTPTHPPRQILRDIVNERAVRILLECILVSIMSS